MLKRNGAKHIPVVKSEEIGAYKQRFRNQSIRLQTDLKRLRAFSTELEKMEVEMFEMRKRSQVWDLGYFQPEEHDKIENLVFRYLILRNSLWEVVNYYKYYRDYFSGAELQTKGFLIGYSAGLHLAAYSSLLVATFLNEPSGKSKINEAYPRSEIPAGTYDMLFSMVTSIDNLEAIKVAWVLFSNSWKDKSSTLYRISQTDREYSVVIENIRRLHEETESRVEFILKEKSLLFPDTTNRLRHTMIVKLAKEAKTTLDDNLYAARGILFSNVSDIKIPLTEPLAFSAEQKRLIKSLLEPGDVILTYTAGYMSNIFLPGIFKHGIAYIGTLAQRKELGIIDMPSNIISGIDKDEFLKNILKEKLDSGYPVDVIEAVAEGVVFNSLDLLLDTHINRIVILRPRLSGQDKREALLIIFSLLGSNYDFKFDFNDGSYQCCTEVIYRALNSRGTFNFPLIKRMGSLTLTADDILEYHFLMEPKSFDVILYAEENPLSGSNRARIFIGEKGGKRVKALMATHPITRP